MNQILRKFIYHNENQYLTVLWQSRMEGNKSHLFASEKYTLQVPEKDNFEPQF